MQSVLMTVVNSGSIEEHYRKGDLEFMVPALSSKSVELSLPTDADFVVWLAGKSNLTGTINYGENDPSTVVVVSSDYSIDPLDGLVMSNETTPVAMTLPAYTAMFSGDATGGTGNIITLRRNNSGAVTVVPTGSDEIDGSNTTRTFAGAGAIELQAVHGGYIIVGGDVAFT